MTLDEDLARSRRAEAALEHLNQVLADDREHPELTDGDDDVRIALISLCRETPDFETYDAMLLQIYNDYQELRATRPDLLQYARDTPDWSRETDAAVRALLADPFHRDEVSHLAMKLSLCPIHFVDWAICFDDEDPTCAQIRQAFPVGHDT